MTHIICSCGGYQIFSLAKLRKIGEEGVHFQNHVDGPAAFISPKNQMKIQSALGNDIAMVLDECRSDAQRGNDRVLGGAMQSEIRNRASASLRHRAGHDVR